MSNSIDLFVGERIQSFRKKRRLSQDDLAGTLNLSRQQLQKYEVGITRVPISVIADISNALGIKILDLMNGIDDIKNVNAKPPTFITGKRTSPLNILLVEDNATDELLTRKAIDSCKQHCEVYSVADGLAALEYLRNCSKGINPCPLPDVVFLDLNIPRMRGDEALKSMKSGLAFQHIPIVVVTNSITQQEMIRVYKLGASGFIVKSFSPEEFYAKISTVVDYWAMMILPSM